MFIIFITVLRLQLYICQSLSNCTLSHMQFIIFQLYLSKAVRNSVCCSGEQLLRATTGSPAKEDQARLQLPPRRSPSEPPSRQGDIPRLLLPISVTHIWVRELQESFQVSQTKARSTSEGQMCRRTLSGRFWKAVWTDSPRP